MTGNQYVYNTSLNKSILTMDKRQTTINEFKDNENTHSHQEKHCSDTFVPCLIVEFMFA